MLHRGSYVGSEAGKAVERALPVDEKTKEEIKRNAAQAAKVAESAAKQLEKAAQAGAMSTSKRMGLPRTYLKPDLHYPKLRIL